MLASTVSFEPARLLCRYSAATLDDIARLLCSWRYDAATLEDMARLLLLVWRGYSR